MTDAIMTPNYVSLHNHSFYSLLDGLSSPKALASEAKKHGMPAVALTDHGTCAGLYQFQKACKEVGIKPILGMEAYFVDNIEVRDKTDKRWHLLLLAKNKVGYRNLIALNSSGYTSGYYYKPRIDMSMIRRHSEGLIACSACAQGIVCGPLLESEFSPAVAKDMVLKYCKDFQEVFKDDFYIEIMSNQYDESKKEFADKLRVVSRLVYEIAQQLNIPTIFTCDSHYCAPEDAPAHDLLLSIQTKDTIKNPDRFSYFSKDFFLKSPQQVFNICGADYRHLMDNTIKIADKIEEDIIQPAKDLLPNFPLPSGIASEEDYLKSLLEAGMRTKGLIDKPEYCDRIRTEFQVIMATGYPKYFLILWDLIQFARNNGIRVGPGRGSGVASLCLYCLGVTALDPIKHKLMFSRFLSPDRVSPPDVDLDFDQTRQHEIFDYIVKKYGVDCIARIGTYSSLKAKDAIKRTGKAMDVGGDWERAEHTGGSWESGRATLSLVDAISKSIPDGADVTIDSALRESMELRHFESQHPEVFKFAKKIQGTLSSAGVHPAGIVICREPVVNYSPLRVNKDVVCTQFEMSEVEELGMLKIDILALSTLTVIDKCIALIKERTGNLIQPNLLEPNDPLIFRMLNDKKTDGVFQFEGYGITKLLKEIRVDTFEDMIVCNALFRPGTLRAGIHQLYCDYKHGLKEVSYVHPAMKDVLCDTYGMMIYQEDVIRTAVAIAGFTDLAADKLRKAVGKKIPELMAKSKAAFVEGCVKKGVSQQVGEKVFELIDFFSGYGFNRSHAAAYAFLAYQTAWLKYYFPLEFYCSLLSVEGDDDKRLGYEKFAATFKGANVQKLIAILPVDINKSKMDYVIEGDGIRRPLRSLMGVGDKAAESIIKHQPFNSFESFVSRTSINTTVLQALAKSGCFKHWAMNNESLMEQFEKCRDAARKARKREQTYGDTEGLLF